MGPDFKRKTVDLVAKRAGFICSNPDCNSKTVGPNSEPNKSTMIGEAAHIFGSRPNSKRYKPEMTDSARAAITNAIWLCRNCHKIIDSDEFMFSSSVLFKWRELHEEYITSQLGNKTAKINSDQLKLSLSQFEGYPPIVRRIIVDKPDGWEYSLTAELMRFFNTKHLRRLRDLDKQLYIKPEKQLSYKQAFDQIHSLLDELTILVYPLVNIIDELNKSFGEPGVEGDVDEIHHICILMSNHIEHIVNYEERISFSRVPKEYEKLQSMLKNTLGSQLLKIEEIPNRLDEVVTMINDKSTSRSSHRAIKDVITFRLPDNWAVEFEKEFDKVLKFGEKRRRFENTSTFQRGCLRVIIAIVSIISLLLILF